MKCPANPECDVDSRVASAELELERKIGKKLFDDKSKEMHGIIEKMQDNIVSKVPWKIFIPLCVLVLSGIGGSYAWTERCKSEVEDKIAGKEWVKKISDDVEKMREIQAQSRQDMAVFFDRMERFADRKNKLDDDQTKCISENTKNIGHN